MTLRTSFLVLLGLGAGAAACSQVKVTNAPQGALHITCHKGMKDCVTRAQKTCGDKGYYILSGTSRMKLLGGPSSPYRKPSEIAELDVRCGVEDAPPEHDIVFKLPKRKDVPADEGTPVAPAAPTQQCVPGATQRCLGPGACTGAQVCLTDGGGFGACDCGSSESSAHESPSHEPSESAHPAPQKKDGAPAPEVTTAPSKPGSEPKVPDGMTPPQPTPLEE